MFRKAEEYGKKDAWYERIKHGVPAIDKVSVLKHAHLMERQQLNDNVQNYGFCKGSFHLRR